MTDKQPLLEVKKLSKSFGGVRAVQDVSFTLYPGELVAIVGDNGAGKSTLIKMIAGTYVPDSGEIWIEGIKRDIRNPQGAMALGIETMYQDLSLIPTMDAAGNIFLGHEPRRNVAGLKVLNHKQMQKKAGELMKRLGIDIPSMRIEVEYLSGGERQAVGLSRALKSGSLKLLIMDEPTAALAVEEQTKVLEITKTLNESGVTIIIISHNLDHVLSVSKRILVMKSGKIVADFVSGEITKEQVAQSIVTGTAGKIA